MVLWMNSKDFSGIRHYLGRTQKQLSRLICVSPKTIQSFEQGWRTVPIHVERQLLFLLALKGSLDEKTGPCWEIRNCPAEWRKNCTAWEFKAGHFCWFINGTFCQGEEQISWQSKMKLCEQCKVYRSLIPLLWENNYIYNFVRRYKNLFPLVN